MGLLFSVIAYSLLFFYKIIIPEPLHFFILPIVIVGSLLPDIDIETSKIFSIMFYLLSGLTFTGILINDKRVSISSIVLLVLIKIPNHRGIMHNPIFLTFLALPVIYYNYVIGSIFLLSIMSHLLFDIKVFRKILPN